MTRLLAADWDALPYLPFMWINPQRYLKDTTISYLTYVQAPSRCLVAGLGGFDVISVSAPDIWNGGTWSIPFFVLGLSHHGELVQKRRNNKSLSRFWSKLEIVPEFRSAQAALSNTNLKKFPSAKRCAKLCKMSTDSDTRSQKTWNTKQSQFITVSRLQLAGRKCRYDHDDKLNT